jgi:5-hmdU DNA kinase, helical domain
VFEAYWHLAAERQRIFERRHVENAPEPWTDDEIIGRYKFTNPWRASDRASQFLIRDVIYGPSDLTNDDLLVRIVLFRLFSRPATWRALEERLGPIGRTTLRGRRLPATLAELHATGPIYTNAFILCATKAYGHDRKYLNHLELVRHMLRGGHLQRSIARARSLKSVYEVLRSFPLIGPFMAYQLAIDINYSELLNVSENEFTVPGPGAVRGIRKIFPEISRREMPAVIHRMVAEQETACTELGITPPKLFGLPLRAIDCQNLFCELDKYARVRFPELVTNRHRIKAKFKPSPEPLSLFYPPKWGINDRLPGANMVADAA